MSKKSVVLTSLAFSAILFAGCSYKEPKSFDSGRLLTINNSILEQKYKFVPKDPGLSKLNFIYEMYLKPQGGYMLPNDLVVKTFLLAHNSTTIVLISHNKDLLASYYDYFSKQGVKADIVLQPLDKPNWLKDQVQALFFNDAEAAKYE